MKYRLLTLKKLRHSLNFSTRTDNMIVTYIIFYSHDHASLFFLFWRSSHLQYVLKLSRYLSYTPRFNFYEDSPLIVYHDSISKKKPSFDQRLSEDFKWTRFNFLYVSKSLLQYFDYIAIYGCRGLRVSRFIFEGLRYLNKSCKNCPQLLWWRIISFLGCQLDIRFCQKSIGRKKRGVFFLYLQKYDRHVEIIKISSWKDPLRNKTTSIILSHSHYIGPIYRERERAI